MRRLPIFALVMSALAAGCGGPQVPAVPASQSAQAHVFPKVRAHSWILPEPKHGDLLYISNVNTITTYSYPKGKLVGTLSDFENPYGECVDAKGNVYITDSRFSKIYEYAHGGTKPIATIGDPQYEPYGCAIDPTTGNLAVANYETNWGYSGNIAIYHKARGYPKSYVVENFYYYYYCGYDAKGNLFLDGLRNGGFGFEFGELVKGKNSIKEILLPQTINAPGGIQWDGKYVAVADQAGAAIYQFSIGRGKATLEGTTPLTGAGIVGQFDIDGATVVVPNQDPTADSSSVLYYPYPGGGNPTQTITDGVFFPYSAVVSHAGSR